MRMGLYWDGTGILLGLDLDPARMGQGSCWDDTRIPTKIPGNPSG